MVAPGDHFARLLVAEGGGLDQIGLGEDRGAGEDRLGHLEPVAGQGDHDRARAAGGIGTDLRERPAHEGAGSSRRLNRAVFASHEASASRLP